MKNKGKKVNAKTVITLCILLFIAGFIIGQFLPIPALEDYTLTAAMRRPGSRHHRR